MKWFRHQTTASDDEFIAALEDAFGDSGYAWWWRTLERIGQNMDGSEKCCAEYPIDRWMGFLRIKRKGKLIEFLEFCRNFGGNSPENLEKFPKLSYEISGNILKIGCHKLLELRDEYSKKSGQTPEKIPPSRAQASRLQTPEPERKNSPLPPPPVERPQPRLQPPVGVELKNGFFRGEGRISVIDRISTTALAEAKRQGPGWDIYHLAKLYDDGIAAGKREPPRNWDKAFPGWVKTYTKGAPPS